ncbi:MAG TPA: hypothetical protein VG737_11915 [Cyclobacteriaceae bacterium]|nr:hypothetical protein [Cyclobacteriaceae bacterium]
MNNNFAGFNPVFEWWAILAVLVPLFCFFAYKEFNRKQKFLFARMVALTCMMIAVMGIFFRPYLLTSETPPASILLTEGYNKQQADSIVKAAPSARLFATVASGPPEATVIHVNEVGTVENLRYVLGSGLPPEALALLPSPEFRFLPAEKPRGITQIYVPKNIRPNESCSIRGVARLDSSASIQLIGPGGPEDSAQVNLQTGEFTLRFKPRQGGLFLYSAVLKEGKSKVQIGHIPVEVRTENKLRILFLQKFPTAETRVLKNYLAEKGHAVALRYQVSRTNFNYEYSNIAAQGLNKLTPELLTSFDLLFLDSYLFEEMGSGQKSAITESVRRGLGVIVFVDGITGKNSTLNSLLPVKGVKIPIDTVHLRSETFRTHVLPAIPVGIAPSSDLQPVLETKNRILSGYTYSGFGRAGFQLLRETYRIKMEGNMEDYAFIWRDLIERVARTKQVRFKFVMKSIFPNTINEPIQVDVLSDGTQPTLLTDNIFVPIEEDVLLDDVWHAKIWASTPGWHSFTVKNDSTALHYFVGDTTEWKTLRTERQMMANKFFSTVTLKPVAHVAKAKNIRALVWYVLFLTSAGFLWLAPKL